jgi:hypothetical protein
MIPGSVKVSTRLTNLNPQHVTTYIDSVSAIWKHVIHVPYWAKMRACNVMITKRDKADSNQSKLGKECYMNLNMK